MAKAKLKMAKWKLFDEPIENNLKEFADRTVLVKKEYINLLEQNNIPYDTFSEEVQKCYFVRRGVKKKRFGPVKCSYIIHLKNNGESYRSLAAKFNCSTRTIQDIVKGKY